MKLTRGRLGICIGVIGLALTLVPLSAASASSHKPKHTNGSAPNSTLCKDVKNEQTGSSQIGLSIERAIQSGNFNAAKAAMLSAYNTDLGNVQKALSVIKTAPANVQNAFKNLLNFVKQIKTDIQNASSEQGLIASFATLGKNPQLAADGATISNWFISKCGGTPVTTTTVSIP